MFVDRAEEQEGPAQTESAFCEKTLVRWVTSYTTTMRAAEAVVKRIVRAARHSSRVTPVSNLFERSSSPAAEEREFKDDKNEGQRFDGVEGRNGKTATPRSPVLTIKEAATGRGKYPQNNGSK